MKLFQSLVNFQFVAHEGHGTGTIGSGESWSHYLLEPLHAPVWLVAVALAYACYRVVRAKLSSRSAAANLPAETNDR